MIVQDYLHFQLFVLVNLTFTFHYLLGIIAGKLPILLLVVNATLNRALRCVVILLFVFTDTVLLFPVVVSVVLLLILSDFFEHASGGILNVEIGVRLLTRLWTVFMGGLGCLIGSYLLFVHFQFRL